MRQAGQEDPHSTERQSAGGRYFDSNFDQISSSNSSFLNYLDLFEHEVPSAPYALDAAAGEYLDHLWQEGEPEGWAADFVSALKRLVPASRRHLSTCNF